MRSPVSALALGCIVAVAPAPAASAGEPEGGQHQDESGGANDEGDLANKVQDPISDLVSIPVQENLDYGLGPNNRARSTLNIQPVIPIGLSRSWNVVARIIVPVIYAPNVDQMTGGSDGLGDINPSFFLTPAKPGFVIWGVGPAFVFPTATQTALGAGRWSVGPTAVVLIQPKPWTIGVLANNVWSFGGDANRMSVNQLLIQYFINYNLPHGWYLTSSPILLAAWKAPAGEKWLVPFGGGVGKIFKVGKLPFNGSLAAFDNAIKPAGAPDWQLRVQLALLLPK